MVNKLNIDILRWVFRAWRYRLKVETQEINFMLSHLKPGQTAIDIGAHKGAYTYWMSKYVGKDGKVFAFEPQPKLYNQLNKLLEHSNNYNVNLELLALSSSKGEDTMVIPSKKTSPSASINNNKREGLGAKLQLRKQHSMTTSVARIKYQLILLSVTWKGMN